MAAGQGFKTFTTGEVLTAGDVNGYLMQGILVFATSTARDAAITSPQEGQFAYLKDTNVTTYYTGSAWANVDTTGMTNPMTTTGDTIYSSSGSTPARLGIGSTGNVLTVAGGVPTWATPAGGGGMTLLSTTTLSGATVTISSIDQTYKNLQLVIFGVTNATGQGRFAISGFGGTVYFTNNGPSSSTLNDNNGNLELSGFGTSGPDNADASNVWSGCIDNYASTTARKSFAFSGIYPSSRNNRGFFCFGGINSTAAISSLTFSNTAGNLSTGTVLLYGVK